MYLTRVAGGSARAAAYGVRARSGIVGTLFRVPRGTPSRAESRVEVVVRPTGEC